ncbi:hypothetical protein ACGLZ2_004650, partial [Escherichia coli]
MGAHTHSVAIGSHG